MSPKSHDIDYVAVWFVRSLTYFYRGSNVILL